jgi:hypothetical protein
MRKGMAATPPRLSIFRSKTMQKYMQNKEKSVLPRFVAPSVFAFCWIVLTLLIAAGIATWFGKVPLYLVGSGVVLDQGAHADDEATAVILLPASDVSHLRSGLPVQLQIGQSGPSLNRTIDVVSQNLLSPGEVHQIYGLEATGPSLVVTTRLGPAISAHLYAGSLIQAQILIGSQSLLALFPGVNSLLKDK